MLNILWSVKWICTESHLFTTQFPWTSSATCWMQRRAEVESVPEASRPMRLANGITLTEDGKRHGQSNWMLVYMWCSPGSWLLDYYSAHCTCSLYSTLQIFALLDECFAQSILFVSITFILKVNLVAMCLIYFPHFSFYDSWPLQCLFFFFLLLLCVPKYQGKFLIGENLINNKPDSDLNHFTSAIMFCRPRLAQMKNCMGTVHGLRCWSTISISSVISFVHMCWPTVLHEGLDLVSQWQSAELSHGEHIAGTDRLHTDRNRNTVGDVNEASLKPSPCLNLKGILTLFPLREGASALPGTL